MTGSETVDSGSYNYQISRSFTTFVSGLISFKQSFNILIKFPTDHDPIVMGQKDREQFRKELFSAAPRPADELSNSRTQPPLHVFNGSEINKDGDINGNRVLWRAQQIPNRIRRLRSRIGSSSSKLWLTASTPFSFNSRCPSSFRFDRKNLDEDSRQYYFYR